MKFLTKVPRTGVEEFLFRLKLRLGVGNVGFLVGSLTLALGAYPLAAALLG